MKHLKTILSLFALFFCFELATTAQVKSTQKKPAPKTNAKPAAVKKPASQPATTAKSTEASTTVNSKKAEDVAPKTENPPAESKPAVTSQKEEKVSVSPSAYNSQQALYSSAVGLKFLWGVAVTGKHFFKPNHAAEAIFKIRGYRNVGTDLTLSLLYEYHGDIPVSGLRWFAGAGLFGGRFTLKKKYRDVYEAYYGKKGETYYGLTAILGAEYKFRGFPVAVSADWQPSFLLKDGYDDNSGFSAEYGGIGIKYTF